MQNALCLAPGSSTTAWLANVFEKATLEHRRVRIQVEADGTFKVKVGEGAWTPPLKSDPDPYADLSH